MHRDFEKILILQGEYMLRKKTNEAWQILCSSQKSGDIILITYSGIVTQYFTY
jgi:hypothetical protein